MALSLRRQRYSILAIALIVLVLWYLATARETTHNSAFYIKTSAAIERRRKEGPQAPGPATKQFLKARSVRTGVDRDEAHDSTAPKAHGDDSQADKAQGLTSVVDGSDQDQEDTDADDRPGRTKDELELEKQIIRARKREQAKLKMELRNQLKHIERQRQKILSHGKLINPNWVGAAEKEVRPVAAVVDETAPDLDPFRDSPATPPARKENDKEVMPDEDPFRDGPPTGRAEKPALKEVLEHQQEKLAKEQEYLHPEPMADTKPHLAPPAEPAGHGGGAAAAAAKPPVDDLAARKAALLRQDGKKSAKAAAPTPAELELSRILALTPVTIFSKTFCPYSKKAKRILLQAFEIMPHPYVVELDKHEMGLELQKLLKAKTGRSTVPNVLVAGHSIGGGDDMEELWESGKLGDRIKEFGGKKILAVTEDMDIFQKGWSD